jgi:hypothetical protein
MRVTLRDLAKRLSTQGTQGENSAGVHDYPTRRAGQKIFCPHSRDYQMVEPLDRKRLTVNSCHMPSLCSKPAYSGVRRY